MSTRRSAASEVEQELIFELMRERLAAMFGPGGNFRVTLGRPAEDDAFFVATVSDTIAQEVADQFAMRQPAGKRVADPGPVQAHHSFWRLIEGDLGIRSTDAEILDDDVDREYARVHRTLLNRAA